MAGRKEVSRHITTYASQLGIKFVKYNPNVHDALLVDVVAWCRNYVSQEKLKEIFDQILDPENVKRKNLQVYVATKFTLAQKLTVVGVVAFATLLPYDHLYNNVRQLKTSLLALPESQYYLPGMSKSQLRRRAPTAALLNIIAQDDQFPTFSEFNMDEDVHDVGELLFVCVNPDLRVRGVGRCVIAKALHEIFGQYDVAFAELGTHNGSVNPAMLGILESFGFEEEEPTFSYPAYGINDIPWTDLNGNRQYFFSRNVAPISYEFIQDFLHLDKLDLGAKTYTCSAATEDFAHATK